MPFENVLFPVYPSPLSLPPPFNALLWPMFLINPLFHIMFLPILLMTTLLPSLSHVISLLSLALIPVPQLPFLQMIFQSSSTPVAPLLPADKLMILNQPLTLLLKTLHFAASLLVWQLLA